MIALFTGVTSLVAALWDIGKWHWEKSRVDLLFAYIYSFWRDLIETMIKDNLEKLLRKYLGESEALYLIPILSAAQYQ
jgi:hypothetical protein